MAGGAHGVPCVSSPSFFTSFRPLIQPVHPFPRPLPFPSLSFLAHKCRKAWQQEKACIKSQVNGEGGGGCWNLKETRYVFLTDFGFGFVCHLMYDRRCGTRHAVTHRG